MCCRYLLLREHLDLVLRQLGIPPLPKFASRYNVAPGGPIPIVRTGAESGRPEAVFLHWGLAPNPISTGVARSLVNARAETLAARPSFREAFRSRRCLIPASGFYEWEARERVRLPWSFRPAGDGPLCMAGLWERRSGPDGAGLDSCAVITTEPNALMRPIHPRMPAILAPGDFGRWLDPAGRRPEELSALLRPAPESRLTAARVGTRVNRAGCDDELCLLPPAPGEEPEQLNLGLN